MALTSNREAGFWELVLEFRVLGKSAV